MPRIMCGSAVPKVNPFGTKVICCLGYRASESRELCDWSACPDPSLTLFRRLKDCWELSGRQDHVYGVVLWGKDSGIPANLYLAELGNVAAVK